jgi:fluoroquinolone transport system permease protein
MTTTFRFMHHLALNDLRLGTRDGFLVMMAAMAVGLGLIFRALLPWANIYLAEAGLLPNEATDLRLSDLYPMLVSFIGVFQSAVLAGAIFGFLFLDEKDGDTLKALLITRIRLGDYA